MVRAGVPFIDEVPEYEIRDGIVHIIVEGRPVLAMPLGTFRKGMARSTRVIAAYQKERGEVLAMRPPCSDHAASS